MVDTSRTFSTSSRHKAARTRLRKNGGGETCGQVVISRDDECHLKFPFQSKRTGERPFPHAKRHERKSARTKRSSPRYPLRRSALGKGKWCTCSSPRTLRGSWSKMWCPAWGVQSGFTVRNEDEEILAVIVTYNTALLSTVLTSGNSRLRFPNEEKPYDFLDGTIITVSSVLIFFPRSSRAPSVRKATRVLQLAFPRASQSAKLTSAGSCSHRRIVRWSLYWRLS